MAFATLKNKAGKFVLPSGDAFEAAAAGADFKVKGMAPDMLDQTAKEAWPIVSATYILAYEKGDDAAKQQGVVDFFSWALNKGGTLAGELDLVALPASVVGTIEAEMKRIK